MAITKKFTFLTFLGKNIRDQKCRFFSVSYFRYGTVVPFKLSDIGEGIRDVTIKEWYVKPGDRVSQFDNICEVQSDKASVTITSRYDGLIKALHYKVDDIVLIENSLLDIELDDDNGNAQDKTTISENLQQQQQQQTTNTKSKQNFESNEEKHIVKKILATPAVRRIAMEKNINLKDVVSNGKDGRVLKEDILNHLEKISVNPMGEKVEEKSTMETVVPIKGYSKHMWKTMTQSLNIPHFVYSDECNINRLIDYRNEVKDSLKDEGISLSFMPFFIKAASRALEKVPQLNSWLDEENQALRVQKSHNIEITKELNRLQKFGKKSSIPLNDLSNTTFTLSNIGVVGGTYTKPVILPPQIVIGAFGKIQKLPRFDDKQNIVATNIISISWAADHRVVDGVTMAKYSNFWKYYIENPIFLLLGV
ncbi:lipoamide acyltransferase component, mitochondrial [Apis mellifera carnica]|nr:lipoamide acyltransferase component, mitochondrial [Apis mellifera carnica]